MSTAIRNLIPAWSLIAVGLAFALTSSSGSLGAAVDSGEGAFSGDLQVSFDIKPTSCPNPVNPPGVLSPEFPTAILGTDEVDAMAIQPSSLLLVLPGGGGLRGTTEIPPIATNIEDVATPYLGGEECGCTEEGPDGFDDLTVHFDADLVLAALAGIPPGVEVQICIIGTLIDGTPFEGCDCVFVVGPVSVDASSWGQIKSSYR